MKNLRVTVNGVEYDVQVEEMDEVSSNVEVDENKNKSLNKFETPKEKSVKPSPASSGAESVNAPMPGTILSINVNKGDSVKKGQVLLILEAMKMENEIIAPKDGTVESINVNKGENVESGASLVFIK